MHIKKGKKISFILMIIPFLFFMLIPVSCGNSSGSKNNNGGGKQSVTIKFVHFEGSGVGNRLLQKMINQFEKKNPGIKIVQEIRPFSKYKDKLMLELSSGMSPDIFEFQGLAIAQVPEKSVFLDLAPYSVKYPALSFDNFYPQSIHFFGYNEDGLPGGSEKIYGYPKDFSPTGVLFCNKRVFDIAGVTIPANSPDETSYENLLKKLLQRDSNGKLLTLGVSRPGPLLFNYGWPGEIEGNRYLSPSLDKVTLDTPANRRILAYYARLIYKGLYGSITENREEIGAFLEQQVSSGKVAIYQGAHYYWPVIKSVVQDEIEIIHKNHFIGSKPTYQNIPAYGWAISSKTKHPEETVKFLAFLAGKEGSQQVAATGYNIPPLKSVALSAEFAEKSGKEGRVNSFFLDVLKTSTQPEWSPYINADIANSLFASEFREILDVPREMPGESEIGAKLAKLEKELNAHIAEMRN